MGATTGVAVVAARPLLVRAGAAAASTTLAGLTSTTSCALSTSAGVLGAGPTLASSSGFAAHFSSSNGIRPVLLTAKPTVTPCGSTSSTRASCQPTSSAPAG